MASATSLQFDLICGVPYTALPIATTVSVNHHIPMVMRRKEQKDYGTKKVIEGVFHKGQRSVIIEDIITSGSSILETISPLNDSGLDVTDIIVIVDREQGGRDILQEKGYQCHSLFTLSEILTILYDAGRISVDKLEEVRTFITNHQLTSTI